MWWMFAGCGSPAPTADAASGGVVVERSQGVEADLIRVNRFLDTRPKVERPIREAGVGELDAGGLSAESCGSCHPDQLDQWRLSVHAQAWVDRQFQAEIGKSDNRWLCLGCHTPLLVQQDRWPVGLVDGDVERPHLIDAPVYDAALRDEGITCAACHLRDGVIHGPGLPDSTSPHAVVADPDFRGPGLCLGCHQAEEVFPDKGFVCTFQTGEEWQRSPWSSQGGCPVCHMPEQQAPAAKGGPVRTVRAHWWKGAGIAKIPGKYPPPEANRPGLALALARDGDAVAVTTTNANAGHMLPTGDPERWVQVVVRFLAGDTPVGEPVTLRFGQTWEWVTPPRKVADNRLAPLESRVQRIPIPKGATRVEAVGSSHRISVENAAYHHLDGYPTSVETHRMTLDL
ncbi:MAG: hypothetical protein KC656_27345 [Myxococcales bacterium]|nr:hypothetical protein [Myxococcales bacterium]MCA9571596.1 hypothetical protein [Myxococcales bacterium]